MPTIRFAPPLALLILLACVGPAYAGMHGGPPAGMSQERIDALPDKKTTNLGLYITAREAWFASIHSGAILLDVRTVDEYVFVGHAKKAYNVPFMRRGTWNAGEGEYEMVQNPDFLQKVQQVVEPGDTVFVMCRSGGRGAMAVNAMAEAGYTRVYNVVDGFEGDAIKDSDSYFDGKRMKNGWKNSGAPWTYDLNPTLIYK